MKKPQNERRKGPDIWVKFVRAAGVISWVIIFIIVLIMDKAKPEAETFFDRVFQIQIRQYWDHSLLNIVLYLSILQFAISVFSLAVNKKRHRRKSDRYSKSLFVILSLSLLIIFFSLKNIYF